MTEANTIYIGSKPPMSYVLAVIRAFNLMGADNVVLKARGRAISRAVDVAEIARHRFLTDIQPAKIEIGTEQMPIPDGGTRGVSTIAITIAKTGVVKEPEAAPSPTIDVSEIKGVGGARAERLRKAGFPTVESLAKTEPGKLSELTGISEKFSAKLIESAKGLLKQR